MRPARRSRAPALLLGLAALALALWGIPVLQVAALRQAVAVQPGLLPSQRLQLEHAVLATENAARGTLAVILGGTLLLAGLLLAWRRVDATRVARVSERFTAAVEQLGSQRPDGSPRTETRIGGLYALDRIARESNAESWPVIDVLTAYVRGNAPWPPRAHAGDGGADTLVAPRADIQAALSILARRRPPPSVVDVPLDLHASDLRGASLAAARFEGVNLQDANLDWADLSRAQLRGANLRAATLRGARLSGANLEGAHATRADLEAAHLDGASLRGADLNAANLKGADLWEANLTEANLRDADLRRADLAQARLEAAILWRANLEGADLEGAALAGAHLERANLHGATGLTQAQGEAVITDHRTILPDPLRPPPEQEPLLPAAAEPPVRLELSPAAQAALLELARRGGEDERELSRRGE